MEFSAILTGSSSYSSVVAPLSRPGPQKRLQLKFPGDGGGGEKAATKREKHQQGGSTTTIHSPMRGKPFLCLAEEALGNVWGDESFSYLHRFLLLVSGHASFPVRR